MSDFIKIYGAREHNLKNITVQIPKNKLTVITGPSGSGKSSLALDILFTEGQRRYIESLSSYARQFLGVSARPDFDSIEGLCPSIAIEQKTVSNNPRSTVGTITEIYDYLRVLYARAGEAHCPRCKARIKAESPETIAALLIKQFAGDTILIAAPVAHQKKGEFQHEMVSWFEQGFYRFRIDGVLHRFSSLDEVKNVTLKKTVAHTIDILLDSLTVDREESSRITEAIERSFSLTKGLAKIIVGDKEHLYAAEQICIHCAISIPPLEPRLFSFNSPIGACEKCNGLGFVTMFSWNNESDTSLDPFSNMAPCSICDGARLNKYARAVTVGSQSIHTLCSMPIEDIAAFFNGLTLDEYSYAIVSGAIIEIQKRLQFLIDVGLAYLTLARTAGTLSGGEGQRIRLATQIGSALSGVLYVLDEPSIGLHQRDNDRLIETLKKLRDLDNTVLVVEHDLDTIRHADYVIDMGPAAGVLGGHVTACGTPEELMRNPRSLTGAYLSGAKAIHPPTVLRQPTGIMVLHHARKHNLQDVTVSFPLGTICAVSGVSGSGKSTLIMQELVPAVIHELGGYSRKRSPHQGMYQGDTPKLTGADSLQNLVLIDQTPIGRIPRSNPATYLGIFDYIRKLFASLPESLARGYGVGRFSFNTSQGACFTCRGDGVVTVEMHFLPAVRVTCKECNGKRYNKETLQIFYKEKNIADILQMTAYEAAKFFAAHHLIAKRLNLLCEVGLDYIALGQPSTTLSGGEAQRIKLVEELSKRGNSTLYILDEPTTGLHTNDVEKLLGVLNRLVEKGNSMIIIEHNIDVLRVVDYLIDLGPEGGTKGGMIVAAGTPAQVALCKESFTGQYLARAS